MSLRYQDIDWQAVWLASRGKKSWRKKKRADWDRRAADFARRNADSTFAGQLLTRIDPPPHWSVLDVGCGPGTLALPLAGRVREVTALDFSEAMLAELKERAAALGHANIRPVHASWEDDWQALGIAPHDLVIASRSLAVDDLRGALVKLDRFAGRRAWVVDRVGSGPVDPLLFKAVGREFEPGPDYIVTINILYSLGIQARLDFITLREQRAYASREAAADACRWMLGELSPEEEARLAAHLNERLVPDGRGGWRMDNPHYPCWAVIWWDKQLHGAASCSDRSGSRT